MWGQEEGQWQEPRPDAMWVGSGQSEGTGRPTLTSQTCHLLPHLSPSPGFSFQGTLALGVKGKAVKDGLAFIWQGPGMGYAGTKQIPVPRERACVTPQDISFPVVPWLVQKLTQSLVSPCLPRASSESCTWSCPARE